MRNFARIAVATLALGVLGGVPAAQLSGVGPSPLAAPATADDGAQDKPFEVIGWE